MLTPVHLGVATAALALADWGSWMAGESFFPGGPLDEMAHLLTALIALWMLTPALSHRMMVPALTVSVAIDLDHLPGRLGGQWLTAGTPRPYPHSLLTIAVVLAVGLLVRQRRDIVQGIAFGLAIHFFRDLSEPRSGVAVFWPWSHHSFHLPHASFVGAITIIVLLDAARLRGRARLISKAPASIRGPKRRAVHHGPGT